MARKIFTPVNPIKPLPLQVDGLDVDVNVADAAPIPAFCSSDEEGEDPAALLYLPIGRTVL